ncbi:MAG: PAS domain-containing protein [Pseudomonadota bacterium]|nr:PAS domain-containing protein [Pseudomonadota bacterium]
MLATAAQPQDYLDAAIHALGGDDDWKAVLDQLPVPVYTTDAEGAVTYWNQACVVFAGREPQLGEDRWCVSWRIFTTDGEVLPHDKCPMADAIKTRKSVRGAVAIAMRPDGTRRAFTPYPTPLFNAAGDLIGAVNMLIDVSDEQSEVLDAQATRCRRLARATLDREASRILGSMARGYEDTATSLRQQG